MTVPYTDPQTIHNPATGATPPASWGDSVRDGLEFLVRPPGCVVEVATATPTVNGNNAWVSIEWTAADRRDTDSYHAAGSEAVVIPAGLGGWYNLSGTIAWASNVTGTRMLRYTINGAGDDRIFAVPTTSNTLGFRASFSRDVLLVAGDTLRLQAWQNSGATLNVEGTASIRLVSLA